MPNSEGAPENHAGPAHHGFDPNQPRVPVGHHDGGQWTATPGSGQTASPRREAVMDRSGKESWGSYVNTYRGDGTLAEQRVFNRDGSRIVSQFNAPGGDWDERHTVVTPDGTRVTFENRGDVQIVYDGDGRPISATVWADAGPEPLATVQKAYLAPHPIQRGIEAAAAILFTWLSSRNGPDSTAVLTLPTQEYRFRTDGKFDPISVRQLTEDELGKACPDHDKVQEQTNAAAGAVNRADYSSAATYGTAVHVKLRDNIKRSGNRKLSAEVSLLKTVQETGEHPQPEKQEAKYGTKGSIRVDVLEKTDHNTVCVYDIKTGRTGLIATRILEIAQTVRLRHPDAQSIVVLEMRPQR
jgi:hypothetical protein